MELPIPKPFSVIGQNTNLAKSWDTYLKRFGYYIQAAGVTKDERKKALLLHLSGEEVQDIFETLECGNSYQDAVDALTTYFNPKKNIAYERHVFRQAKQSKDETIDNFIIRLKQLSVSCDYPADIVNDMIRDQVVENCTSTDLKRKFLREQELTLEKVQSIARSSEMAELHVQKMNGSTEPKHEACSSHPERKPEEACQIRKQTTKQKKTQFYPKGIPAKQPARFKTCFRCGVKGHSGHECLKAKGIQCRKCSKYGHFARMCQTKKREVRCVENENQDGNESSVNQSGEQQYVFGLNSKVQAPYVELEIEGIKCKLLIDSGASVNCLDRATYEKVKSKCTKIMKSETKIYPYAQSKPLKILGITECNVKVNEKYVKIKFHVIDSQCTPLIGQQSAVELGLVKFCVNNIADGEQSVDRILSEYSDRFKGLGKLKDFQLKLNIDEKVKPVAQPNRRIPFKMRQQVNEKIKELLDADVIEKVEGATPWISPLVVIPKDNGDIRICVDMRQANAAIVRERFPMPNIDETLEELDGARFFSKLDLKMGFHQLELDPDSRDITCFVTNDGLYRYRRLMFGISSAPEVYQRVIQHTIQDIPNCKNISDDVIVYGATKEEHDAALQKVLQRLRDKNLTLNKEKCEFFKTSITFMGHTLTSEGLKPQESKIQAVLNTVPPLNVKEVKSFLGLLNYCSKFLPNFATVSEPIRKLTRKNVSFAWGKEQQKAFENLKLLLTSASVMAYYNPNAETTITVDASPYGLGAILAQKQRDGQFKPVAYASRTLNQVERRYSQIERECLAVTWGIEKFRTYVYGLSFKVVTDHKPLINIFKPTHKPPARLERMLLRLQSYKFTVEFQPGASNPADILSRSTLKQEKCEISSITEKYMDYLCENAVPSAMTLELIDKESSEDKFIQELIQCITHDKWPKNEDLKIFFKLRNELSVHNNTVLRGNRLVIPQKLRARVLQLAHETHQGIVKTKQMLREKVYWPGIDSEIENLIKTCYQCQLMSKPPQQAKITPTELPDGPWQSVGMDLTGPFPGGEYLLVVIDYYSRFPEVEIMKSTTSLAIIQRLLKIFATHGLPNEIKTDNAPNMVSEEITDFFTANGIKHHRITPYHPQAAGLVENFNKTLGNFVKTAVAEHKNWRLELYKFLMTYRTTPHVSTGSAPATLLFNRTVKNKLPHFQKKREDSKLRERDSKQKQKMKKYADRRASTRTVYYRLGQKVLILNRNSGKLESKWNKDIYTVVGQKGNQITLKSKFNDTFRRHASQVRPFYVR